MLNAKGNSVPLCCGFGDLPYENFVKHEHDPLPYAVVFLQLQPLGKFRYLRRLLCDHSQ